MTTKRILIDIPEKTAEQITELYGGQKAGLEMAVQNYQVLRAVILPTIRGIFTEEELTALLDTYNASMFDPRAAYPGMLAYRVTEAEKYESTCTRHGADPEKLIAKLEKLNHAQALILAEECWLFWYRDPSAPKRIADFSLM